MGGSLAAWLEGGYKVERLEGWEAKRQEGWEARSRRVKGKLIRLGG